MKPQDILILLKILTKKDLPWRQMDLAHELGISTSEIAMALERARVSHLINPSKKKVFRDAFLEFLTHGLRYVYPVEPGAFVRGMPTAHSASPLSQTMSISNDMDVYVWPDAEGSVRGQAIEPLYSSVPQAAKKDPQLYELLALIDGLRVGRAREKQIATEELTKRLQ